MTYVVSLFQGMKRVLHKNILTMIKIDGANIINVIADNTTQDTTTSTSSESTTSDYTAVIVSQLAPSIPVIISVPIFVTVVVAGILAVVIIIVACTIRNSQLQKKVSELQASVV